MKALLDTKQTELKGLEAKADLQLMEHRAYIERQERLHQKEIDRLQHQFETQQRLHSDLVGMCEIFFYVLGCTCEGKIAIHMLSVE